MSDRDALLAHIPAELRTRDVVGVLSGMDGDCSTMSILLDAIRDAGGTEDHVLAMVRALIYGAKKADTPRLIYADYLEESGEGQLGEFVRCQVELARTPTARIVDDQICRKCNRRCGDRPSSKYCEHGGDPDGKSNHAWENPLRRRERELHPQGSIEDIRFAEILGLKGATYAARAPDWPRWEYRRGFISSVTLDWQTWLRHHAGLFWSPRQTVEVPSGICHCGEECESHYSGSGHSPVDMPDCIPRPFVPTAQPLETVRLTITAHRDDAEAGMFIGDWFVMPDLSKPGVGCRFDRVKCGVCDAGWESSVSRDCPSCHGSPLNLWECPSEWPGVEFVMPG